MKIITQYVLMIVVLTCSGMWSYAQEKGFSKIGNSQKLQQEMKTQSDKRATLSSDFIQEKEMSLLEDVIISKGKFFFKKEDKIRIEYTSPFEYLLVMTDGQITIKDGEKINKINTRNSSSMQSVNQLIMDCMSGTVFENNNFQVSAYENQQDYLLVLKPEESAMKMMFAEIKIYMNKSDKSVNQLIMKENSGDQTIMKFNNTQINPELPNALFSIR